jgi:hypothetical protein
VHQGSLGAAFQRTHTRTKSLYCLIGLNISQVNMRNLARALHKPLNPPAEIEDVKLSGMQDLPLRFENAATRSFDFVAEPDRIGRPVDFGFALSPTWLAV